MSTRFGKCLRKLRVEQDQTQEDMARILNVTKAYLSAVELGKRRVPDSWPLLLIKEYNLNDTEAAELQKAAYENKTYIEITLDKRSDLVLLFARKIDDLTNGNAERLQKLLESFNTEGK